ncbi:MAG: hypothetical protein V4584_11620 [Verrucomicrobiota bacterium]
MKYDVFQLPESHQQLLDETPEPQKVQVILLDADDLPLARGTAILPLLLGVGVFWPCCPMPGPNRLAAAKCFTLPTGEILKLKEMTLCSGSPPHYDFWVCQP